MKWFLFAAILLIIVLLVREVYRMVVMPGQSFSGPMPELSTAESQIAQNLERHIGRIAGEIGERNVLKQGTLEATAKYISDEFTAIGYEVHIEKFIAQDRYEVSNIYVELPGKSDEYVIIGAHYDTVPGSPGANDNTSGVAALLELARTHYGDKPNPTIRFIAFVNEEPPFFGRDMGSMEHASNAIERGEKIICMFSLETIGYYTDEENSQKYPFPFSVFYPSQGNFIGFVANTGSRKQLYRAVTAFRSKATIPSEGLAAPRIVPDINRSDQISFWRYGIPGIMITDTADFRYQHYHKPSDDLNVINYPEFARVVYGLSAVVREFMK